MKMFSGIYDKMHAAYDTGNVWNYTSAIFLQRS